MDRWTIRFDYPRPPLTENQRHGWRQRASIVKKVRASARIEAEYRHQIPPLGYCRVTLTWVVATRHHRDEDNIVPTLKAMCDGLVDAKVVEDDIPLFMDKIMPRIVYDKEASPHLELLIEKAERGET
ncbi:hypothetical protein AS850_02880 [Frondihabitans sp. 762G35]|uniref:hypothetical protein n=1 Tax=Frondihabitans sp. 762G35 TaxID=1446794 RepID=UPI000D21629E|nr:hypothetical protein [Frondihabitans sp. 762G35]ARC56017.1 hypothetical protein AS850_02880 [Frondihabitans sp. 762G35]